MILLTGATGFVGGELAGELINGGHRIRCLVRSPGRAGGLRGPGCEVVRGDITDPASVLDAMDGDIEAAVHLVGILTETKDATFEKIHREGTRNVVEACLKKGVRRYLHVSALGTRKDARSRYHRTKWEAEEIIRASGLEYTIFRPSVIFGKEDKFTNLFARAIKVSPVVFIPGDGGNLMQPVFVKDLVKAMRMSITMDETKNRVFEIGGPDRYTFDRIIDLIAKVLGRKRLKVHVPMLFMRLGAAVAETVLPVPPITRDQLLMLEEDNVTEEETLSEVFNIKPTGFEQGMRTYLH